MISPCCHAARGRICPLFPAVPAAGAQVLVRRQCERGHPYCGRECSGQARHERRREAAQRSACGRRLHAAERSRRWRACQGAESAPISAVQSNDTSTVAPPGCSPGQLDGPVSTSTVVDAEKLSRHLPWHCRSCRRPAHALRAPERPAPRTQPRSPSSIRIGCIRRLKRAGRTSACGVMRRRPGVHGHLKARPSPPKHPLSDHPQQQREAAQPL